MQEAFLVDCPPWLQVSLLLFPHFILYLVFKSAFPYLTVMGALLNRGAPYPIERDSDAFKTGVGLRFAF